MKADMDNTGMYVRYIPITRDEVIEFCKNPETLSGSEGFAEKVEKQIEYKDLISRKYTKKRQVDINHLAFFYLETDLAFSPTLACWRFRSGSHHYFSLSIFSAGLTSKTRHAHFVHF